MHRLTYSLAYVLAVTILAGCSSPVGTDGAAGTETLEPEYAVGQVSLEAGLAKSRMAVLEMCNTGPGAKEMAGEWEALGFLARSEGMTFMDALKVNADYTYINDQAIIDYGSYTYPTIELLAENCQEVIWLVSRPAQEAALPEGAAKALDEYRTSEIPDLYVDAMQTLFNQLGV